LVDLNLPYQLPHLHPKQYHCQQLNDQLKLLLKHQLDNKLLLLLHRLKLHLPTSIKHLLKIQMHGLQSAQLVRKNYPKAISQLLQVWLGLE
jgi:hypothetical protein